VARLFVGDRELAFVNDVTKELIKDVVGQRVAYFPISEIKTLTDNLYNEAVKKVWDNPIYVDCLVDTDFQQPTHVDKFGVDAKWKIEVFIQNKDLIDKGINPCIGDLVQFADVNYEVSDRVYIKTIYGQPEHKIGIKLSCTKMRESQMNVPQVSPSDERFTDDGAVQHEFYQQRGFATNAEGATGDVRDMVKNGMLELPEDGPREVSKKGASSTVNGFYDDE